MKNLYFRRTARFEVEDGHVVVIDPNQPRVIHLEPWVELIFKLADGEHTVRQMLEYLAQQYPEGLPAGLEGEIYIMVKKLVDVGIIELLDEPRSLPFYLTVPVSEQNSDDARAAMLKHGFIKR